MSAPSLAHAPSEPGGPWVLCYFLHRYLDFRVPEVESLAEMAGCGGALEWYATTAQLLSLLSPSYGLRRFSHLRLFAGACQKATRRTRPSAGCACPPWNVQPP